MDNKSGAGIGFSVFVAMLGVVLTTDVQSVSAEPIHPAQSGATDQVVQSRKPGSSLLLAQTQTGTSTDSTAADSTAADSTAADSAADASTSQSKPARPSFWHRLGHSIGHLFHRDKKAS